MTVKENQIAEFCPKNQQEWRDWLTMNHIEVDAVWLIIYKKHTKKMNLSWSDAVDEALCFGWIDSTKRPIDEEKYIQYFGKRKPKSNWSKINKEKVERLLQEDLIVPAGLKSIEVAKENGSWTILDSVEALILPDDLAKELKKYPGATDFYEGQSKSAKKGLLYWVVSAKRPETRQKRILEIAENASQNKRPKQFK